MRHWVREPEERALDHEVHQLIEEAIAKLPEAYRDVYVLADVEELANTDIAEMLGLGVAAVKSRLHCASAAHARRPGPLLSGGQGVSCAAVGQAQQKGHE